MEKLKKILKKIGIFVLGLGGGFLALITALILESVFKELNVISANISSYVSLVIPAFLEEFIKIIISMLIFRSPQILGICGVGLGFGILESSLTGSLSYDKPLVHLFFLLIGYLLIFKNGKKYTLSTFVAWLIISATLHWGFNSVMLVLTNQN